MSKIKTYEIVDQATGDVIETITNTWDVVKESVHPGIIARVKGKNADSKVKAYEVVRQDDGVIIATMTSDWNTAKEYVSPGIIVRVKRTVLDSKDVVPSAIVEHDSDYVVLTCDGYTIGGNPSRGGYVVTDLDSKPMIIRNSELVHSNNFFELFGILAALEIAVKNYTDKPYRIYTDSKTCLAWLNGGKCGGTTREQENINKIIDKILAMLKANEGNIGLELWITSKRGEIPSDNSKRQFTNGG